MVKIVVWFSAPELSMDKPPESSWFCFAGSSVVRSGEIISQVFPVSSDLCTYWLPMYSLSELFLLISIGVFQLNLYSSYPSTGRGWIVFTKLLSTSYLHTFSAPCISEYIIFLVGCLKTLNPSPWPTAFQCLAEIPPAANDGPYQDPLSCKPP